MRSSKKRSRSSQNRPRTLGNIINRVFDSSGPEGKVRGTPQQIIEKYQQLFRDAQLSNDRVAAENFQQHAEHYTRMLAEAMREQAAEQEARQQQYQQSGGNQGGSNQGGGNQNGNGNAHSGGQRDYRDRDHSRDRDDRRDRDHRDPGSDDQPAVEVIEISTTESGLVETPEARRRDDQPRDANRDAPRKDGNRDRRDRDFRRDRDDRRRDPADAPVQATPSQAAPAPVSPVQASPAPASPAQTAKVTTAAEKPQKPATQPELPSFITGAAVVDPAPKTEAEPKVRRPRKPKAETVKADAPDQE